jgi:hypothetical protein
MRDSKQERGHNCGRRSSPKGGPNQGFKMVLSSHIYEKAMTDSKRQAHSQVVEMVLNGSKTGEKPAISGIGRLGALGNTSN